MALDTAKATAILRGLTAIFDRGVRSATPFYPRVCTVLPSDGADEQYAMLGDMPGVREWVGDRVFHELRAANFVLANKHWESSLGIKKTDLADDRMGMYRMALPQLASEAAYHPDQLLFRDVIAGAESLPCFDGQFFYDTDHAWGDSGQQSNIVEHAVAAPAAVTPQQFRDAFHKVLLAMLGFKNDRGEPFVRPVMTGFESLMIVVPPALWEPATVGLTAPLVFDSGSGGTNIVLQRPEIVVGTYLTSSTKFHTWNVGAPLRPFVFQAREPLTRQIKGLDDLETKDCKFMTEARYNAGYLAWWNAVLTEFTQA